MGIGQNIVMGEFRSVHLGSALRVLLHGSLSDEYQVTVSFKSMFPLLQNQNFSILLYYTWVWMAGQILKQSGMEMIKLHTLYYYNSSLNCVYTCWPLNIIPANFNVFALWFRAKGWEMNWQMTMSTVKHSDWLWHCMVGCLRVSEFWSSWGRSCSPLLSTLFPHVLLTYSSYLTKKTVSCHHWHTSPCWVRKRLCLHTTWNFAEFSFWSLKQS